VVAKCLAKNNVTALENPLYSPDLQKPDFSFFPDQNVQKGQRFESAEEVPEQATRALTEVSKMPYRNACKSFANIDKSVSLPKGTALMEVLCK
jgi:hypothetical protein